MLTGEERMMRTWRALVAVAAAGLLGLASAFVGTGPATAATNVSYTDYATLQVWQCSGNWNQRWNIF
jgi:hypothetical protein